MRVFTARLYHETNSFAPRTGRDVLLARGDGSVLGAALEFVAGRVVPSFNQHAAPQPDDRR